MNQATALKAATPIIIPPTTPPAMAPPFDFFEVGVGVAVEVVGSKVDVKVGVIVLDVDVETAHSVGGTAAAYVLALSWWKGTQMIPIPSVTQVRLYGDEQFERAPMAVQRVFEQHSCEP